MIKRTHSITSPPLAASSYEQALYQIPNHLMGIEQSIPVKYAVHTMDLSGLVSYLTEPANDVRQQVVDWIVTSLSQLVEKQLYLNVTRTHQERWNKHTKKNTISSRQYT